MWLPGKNQQQIPWLMNPEWMDGWDSTDSSCITGPISHDITYFVNILAMTKVERRADFELTKVTLDNF